MTLRCGSPLDLKIIKGYFPYSISIIWYKVGQEEVNISIIWYKVGQEEEVGAAIDFPIGSIKAYTHKLHRSLTTQNACSIEENSVL